MVDRRVYWYATNIAPEGEGDSESQIKNTLSQLFRGWEPIAAPIGATPESAILRNDIYDRDPLSRWSCDRVTLLGDATHPMTPNLGQGACQAIEDAVVLKRVSQAPSILTSRYVNTNSAGYSEQAMLCCYRVASEKWRSRRIRYCAPCVTWHYERRRNRLRPAT